MSMHMILGVPFVIWACGAAALWVFYTLWLCAHGQRNLTKRKPAWD